MITWDYNNKHNNMSLSNNNLTASYSGNSWGAIRATNGKNKGKWYWEIIIDNFTDAHVEGIGTEDSPLYPSAGSAGTGFRLYRPHNHKNYGLIIDNKYGISPEWGTVYVGNGEVVGLALNIDEGYIDYYKNSEYLGRAFNDINTLGEVFPIITMYSTSQLTANFGTTKFDIATSNPEEWYRLKNEGFLPYDVDSAVWDRIKLSDINISKTNIWSTDKGNIDLYCSISHKNNYNIKYELSINNIKIIELDDFISTPTNIDIQIPIDLFTEEENLLQLIVFDEDMDNNSFEYNIIKEDRDTFTFKRIFNFKEDYISDGNVDVIYSKGIILKNTGIGEINLNIPTEGKSRIKNIEIMDNNQNKGSKSIVPPLTSNSQNGYEASASSTYPSFDVWKAFDDKNIKTDDCWISKDGSPLPQWIQIKLPRREIVSVYTITSRNWSDRIRSPKSWQLQGSLDGIDWIILDERKDIPNWRANEIRRYNITSNMYNYLYYRLVITDKHDDDVDFVSIGELKLYKTDFDIIEEVTIDNEMDYMQDLDIGKVYESRLLTEYSDIKSIDLHK